MELIAMESIKQNWQKVVAFCSMGLAIFAFGMVAQQAAATTTLQPGEVEVSKTATAVPGKINTWDIKLDIKARDTKKTSDTVLVIDRSGSMSSDGRMKAAKDAAKEFIDELLGAGNTTNRIALVSFAGKKTNGSADVETNSGFSTNATSLKNSVNGLSANGGTHTQAATRVASDLINTSTAGIKNIVFLSDGEPTYCFAINKNWRENKSNLEQRPGYTDRWQTPPTVPQSQFEYGTTVGSGSSMWQQYYASGNLGTYWNPRYEYYDYNCGNSAIAQAGFTKATAARPPTLYTIALSAGANGDAVLAEMASPGSNYDGSPADMQAIFAEIAGKIASAAKDITIQDVIAPEFVPIAGSVSNGGVINGNEVSWGTFQLGSADSSGVRSATRTVRIELAPDFTGTGNLYPTNTSVAFNYKDVDGVSRTQTAASPEVNPVLIHTKKVLEGAKADANDEFNITVVDTNSVNYGAVLNGGDSLTAVNGRLAGAYEISENIVGVGQYDQEISHKIGTGEYVTGLVGNEFTLGQFYQKTTDELDVNNDIYVKVTNKAKLGKLAIAKTLGQCAAGPTVTDSGKTFNFEVKNSAGQVVRTANLVVSQEDCHAVVSLENLPQGTYTVVETGATEYTTTHVVSGDSTIHNGKAATVVVGLAGSLNQLVTFNNNYTQERTITVEKTWTGGKTEDYIATFELWRDGAKLSGHDKTLTGNGSVSWTVPEADVYGVEYNYEVKETMESSNYQVSCTDLNDGKCAVPVNGVVQITNTYKSPKTEFSAYKIWEGGPNQHPTIELQLMRSGVDYGTPVTLTNGTTHYTWTGLDKTNEAGVNYTYTVKEVNTPENYVATQQGNTITNTYESPKINYTVEKSWVGGPSPRPDVTVQLYQNGVAHENPVTLTDGVTSNTWTGLDETDPAGVPYVYTVDEVSVPASYEKSVDGNVITNTYQIPQRNINVEKQWVGGEDLEKSDVTVYLTRNSEPFGEPIVLNSNNNWKGGWTNLDATDFYGNTYIYSVNEVEVPGYSSDVTTVPGADGDFLVTNTYVVQDTEFTVNKVWNGGPSPRPSIIVQLYQNGEPYEGGQVELIDGDTTYTWYNLPATDSRGNPYTYTVSEISSLPNYEASVQGNTITNTYIIPQTRYTAEKVWVGGPEERPVVELQLYQNGKVHGEPVALTDGITTYTWYELDATDFDGKPYTYTVDEVNVPENYEKSVDGSVITNTYVSPKMSYTVEKIWQGGPSVHPTVQVQLYRDGEPYGAPVNLKNGVTKYTWTELDQFDNDGVEYTYTVDEVTVPKGYAKYVDNNRITNVYTEKPPVVIGGMGGGDFGGLVPGTLPKSGGISPLTAIWAALLGTIVYTTVYFGQGRRREVYISSK